MFQEVSRSHMHLLALDSYVEDPEMKTVLLEE